MLRRLETGPTIAVARALVLALGLLLAPAHLRAEESATAPAPEAKGESATPRRTVPVPSREEMRRRVDELISFDKLLAAQAQANLDAAPVSFRCEAVRRPGAPAISPRRTSKLTFLDARGLCYGACMISCLSVGVPFDDCDEVCDDVCYGSGGAAAADPPRAPAELQPSVARGGEVVSPGELANSEP